MILFLIIMVFACICFCWLFLAGVAACRTDEERRQNDAEQIEYLKKLKHPE